jgi:hypothetical protein
MIAPGWLYYARKAGLCQPRKKEKTARASRPSSSLSQKLESSYSVETVS